MGKTITLDGKEYEPIEVSLPRADMKKISLGKSAKGLTYQILIEVGILPEDEMALLSAIHSSDKDCEVTINGLKYIPPEQLVLFKEVDSETGEVIGEEKVQVS